MIKKNQYDTVGYQDKNYLDSKPLDGSTVWKRLTGGLHHRGGGESCCPPIGSGRKKKNWDFSEEEKNNYFLPMCQSVRASMEM